MVKKIGSFRRKTRHKLSKTARKKGKINISKYFQTFKIGEKVVLKAEPAVQKGMYRPSFHGKSGIIKARKGSCYNVLVNDKNKQKVIIVHPVHLRKI
ncbi:50S ribosomal protein L21e [Candidatus Woesearchaeota archaeon]|nr:50S ribosomal protein L21e [Candidatus Woesearchaeota archaeon]